MEFESMVGNIVAWIIVGGLAGWLASMLMKTNDSQGLFGNIAMGIVGGLIGGYLANALFGAKFEVFSMAGLITATLGAVALSLLLNLVTGKKGL